MVFLDLEDQGFHRENYYWAQIAAEIRKGNTGTTAAANRIKVEDFILKFKERGKEEPPAMSQSKKFWFTLVGMEEE